MIDKYAVDKEGPSWRENLQAMESLFFLLPPAVPLKSVLKHNLYTCGTVIYCIGIGKHFIDTSFQVDLSQPACEKAARTLERPNKSTNTPAVTASQNQTST